MSFRKLLGIIKKKEATIAVIGLGRVGLPLAASLADAGYNVAGLDVNEEQVAHVNASRVPWRGKEPGLAELLGRVVESERLVAHYKVTTRRVLLGKADVVIVCVPTPVDAFNQPDHSYLLQALTEIAGFCQPSTLLIIESTLAPGTMRDVVDPAVKHLKLFLAHCPERISPGSVVAGMHGNIRVIGGMTKQATKLCIALYQQITRGAYSLRETDAATAEVVKCTENAYRDVQIAFANEVACLCEHLELDFWEVQRLVNSCPGRDVLDAGPGVGGACLPKDTLLLVAEQPYGEWVRGARRVNDYMPIHVVHLLLEALGEAGVTLNEGAKIAVIGTAYRAGIPDTHNSPGLRIAELIRDTGAEVVEHDFLAQENPVPVLGAVRDADAVVFVVVHERYRSLDWGILGSAMRHKVLVDCTGVIGGAPAEGFVYRGIGRGR